jgi:hypothetical protein
MKLLLILHVTAAQIFVRIKRYGDMSILLNSKCSICSARPLTENRFAATVINERNEMKAGIYCQPEPRFRRKCLDLKFCFPILKETFHVFIFSLCTRPLPGLVLI